MTVYIYALCCPITGEIRYVGKTLNVRKRLYGHRYDKLHCHKTHWLSTLFNEGLSPVVEVIETIENSDDTDWQEVEVFWIAYLRFLGCKLTNIDAGGRGGIKRSPETVEKMRISQIGKKASVATRAKISAAGMGRITSTETRSKISISNRGKVRSESVRQRLRELNVGKNPTAETREKMRLSATGRKQSPATIQKRLASNPGKPHTLETRLRISAIRRGKKLSPEAHARYCEARSKSVVSDKTKEKMRASGIARWKREKEMRLLPIGQLTLL